jgi:hypothetical protein
VPWHFNGFRLRASTHTQKSGQLGERHRFGFFAELGFIFPQFPYIEHSRGWSHEDMERNSQDRPAEPVRGAPSSVANLEFHRAGHEVDDIGAEIVARLEARGIPAVNLSMGFPMEMLPGLRRAAFGLSTSP